MSKKTACGIFLGNVLEHYDTAIYSFASPFLAPLFFPDSHPLVALIMAYAIIPLGMVVRPFASLFFGHIGDTRGRKRALTISLFGMALVTFATGCIPLYNEIGVVAPILLLFARLFQNFFSEGEKMGGAIYLLERTKDEKKQDLVSGLYGSSTIIGILLASFLITLLCYFDFMTEGWRLLYFLGSVTAVAALFLRKDLDIDRTAPSQSNVRTRLKNFWALRKATLPILLAAGFSYTCYTMAFVLIVGFVPLISSVTKEELIALNTSFLIFDMVALPAFSYIAYKSSREAIMCGACIAAALLGIPSSTSSIMRPLATVAIIRALIVTIGVAFSSVFHSWAQQLVPPSYRYSLISLSYSLGAEISAAPLLPSPFGSSVKRVLFLALPGIGSRSHW